MMRIHLSRITQRCLGMLLASTLAAGIIAVSTWTGTALETQAANSVGTLTITPKVGEETIAASDYDGSFKVYKVAGYAETGVFTATDAFHFDNYEALLTSEKLSDEKTFKEITQTVTAWLDSHAEIEAVLSGVTAGTQKTLEYGLYLITQDQSATKYTDTAPFLVMIPTYSDGKTETAVTAYPKVSKVTTPDTPDTPHKPHKPHDSTPPKTPAKTGKVALGKSDASTGEALQGVAFILYKADGTAIGTYTTDSEGLVYVDSLPYGGYYFVEAQALDGYVLDETPQKFQIAGEDTVLLTMTNTPITPDVPEIPGEGGATGDDSNMVLYGVVIVAAAAALVGWIVWKKRDQKQGE